MDTRRQAAGPRFAYMQGDHVCALYTTPEQQLDAAIEYIRQGLARGERCLYVLGEHDPPAFRAALDEAGIDVAAEEARGALIILTKGEAYLPTGTFEPQAMISMLEAAVRDALEAGFTGLCAAGDMIWLRDGAPGSERIAEYEGLLTPFYRSHRALGLCLYRRSLPSGIIDHGIATHPVVRLDGAIRLTNPFYEVPELAVRRSPQPDAAAEKVEALEALEHEALTGFAPAGGPAA